MAGFPPPNDNEAYRFPVSIKGVVFLQSRVALLKNNRNEWELPGGKLELGETPEERLRREVEEELNLTVRVGPLLDTWVYHITKGVDVFIVTYGCSPATAAATIRHSAEHEAAGLIPLSEAAGLNMPEGYKRSIRQWAAYSGDPGR